MLYDIIRTFSGRLLSMWAFRVVASLCEIDRNIKMKIFECPVVMHRWSLISICLFHDSVVTCIPRFTLTRRRNVESRSVADVPPSATPTREDIQLCRRIRSAVPADVHQVSSAAAIQLLQVSVAVNFRDCLRNVNIKAISFQTSELCHTTITWTRSHLKIGIQIRFGYPLIDTDKLFIKIWWFAFRVQIRRGE